MSRSIQSTGELLIGRDVPTFSGSISRSCSGRRMNDTDPDCSATEKMQVKVKNASNQSGYLQMQTELVAISIGREISRARQQFQGSREAS